MLDYILFLGICILLFGYLYAKENNFKLKLLWFVIFIALFGFSPLLDFWNTSTTISYPSYTVQTTTSNVPLFCTGVPALNAVTGCGTTTETTNTIYPAYNVTTTNNYTDSTPITNNYLTSFFMIAFAAFLVLGYEIIMGWWRSLPNAFGDKHGEKNNDT